MCVCACVCVCVLCVVCACGVRVCDCGCGCGCVCVPAHVDCECESVSVCVLLAYVCVCVFMTYPWCAQLWKPRHSSNKIMPPPFKSIFLNSASRIGIGYLGMPEQGMATKQTRLSLDL